jgi:hypothetical protein
MGTINIHDEWLSLLDISGTFLAPPVLKEVYPQGLDALDGLKRKRLRQTYEEWSDSYLAGEKEFPKIHEAWIKEVLLSCLDYGHGGEQFLKSSQDIPPSLHCPITEYGVTLSPEYALVDSQRENPNLILVQTYPRDVDLNKLIKYEHYSATPIDQMVQLCRASQCRLGLVTNGENWVLIDAPVGSMSTSAGWQARLWIQETISLQSFVHLLGISRFFVATEEQLPALIDRSLQYQDEVTSALGTQIQRAIEVLIQSLDKYDLESGRTLLHGVTERELYEAALTVMMRLVFLLSAEERGLLLLDDGKYQKNYALSTLRMQLRHEGPEILELRKDGWSRLLALFRMVYGGVGHESLRLPALGGSLFDPDRFTFLEGRAKGSNWRVDEAKPLPIDNRTVLLLLEAIQQFEGRTLSYRSLDIEQMGYVYEGLLDRTVIRTTDVILDVGATRSAEKPLVSLTELETTRQSGIAALEAALVERSGSSISRIRNELSRSVDELLSGKLLTACAGDPVLRDQIKPYANLLRNDSWGYPLVYPAGSYVVTTGSDRRETGSHYTPKPLTEAIVAETLTPIVYVGPAEGLPRENWKLKSPEEILDLKICDPAMGSGAFLVQVCRWLSDRLIDSWANAEADGLEVTAEGQAIKSIEASELMPPDLEARIVIARRLIAERCLYGVDFNPLAVELAKLSIWLITLSKGRPFGFLDHNLRHGDSLLGLQNLEQLVDLSMNPTERIQQGLFVKNIRSSLDEAIELRKNLRSQPIRNIHDIELITKLNNEAREKLNVPNLIADAFIGSVLKASGNASGVKAIADEINVSAGKVFEGDLFEISKIKQIADIGLSTDLPFGKSIRKPFHWPLEFPEVFQRDKSGFDAIVGNPPFLGGFRITGALGTAYRDWLVNYLAKGKRGSADLVAYFFLRVYSLIRPEGTFGLLAVNTIAEGDTRQVGLESMLAEKAIIYTAYPNEPWPGAAAVVTSRVHIYKGVWLGGLSLLGKKVQFISAFLSKNDELSLKKLRTNEDKAFMGSSTQGMGFVLSIEEGALIISSDSSYKDVIFPYLNGEDLNSSPEQNPSRSVICLWDYPEEKAKNYPLIWHLIEKNVKPERQRLNAVGEFALRRPLPERWWQFGEKRPALYHLIGMGRYFNVHPQPLENFKENFDKVLVVTRVSKTFAFAFIDQETIFSDATVVFTINGFFDFAILQSNIHAIFAWHYSSRMKTDLRYSITDAFETFPFPRVENPAECSKLSSLGENFYNLRKAFMRANQIGLTKFYNRYHNQDDQHPDMASLRRLQGEIDRLIIKLYGWENLDLCHGYHAVSYLPVNDCIRYTIAEDVRVELLNRLAQLNQVRFLEENLETKLGNFSGAGRTKTRSKKKANNSLVQHPLDFG